MEQVKETGRTWAIFCLFLFIPVIILLFIFAHLVLIIVASVKAGEGRVFRYPLAIRFFSESKGRFF